MRKVVCQQRQSTVWMKSNKNYLILEGWRSNAIKNNDCLTKNL